MKIAADQCMSWQQCFGVRINSIVLASGKKTPKVETFYPVLSRLNKT
jgi:hypothetical protein